MSAPAATDLAYILCMQSLLRTEFYVQALVVFVKAFATSPFCLESLEDATDKLASALDRALRVHVSRCEGSNLPIPLVWYEPVQKHYCDLHDTCQISHGSRITQSTMYAAVLLALMAHW